MVEPVGDVVGQSFEGFSLGVEEIASTFGVVVSVDPIPATIFTAHYLKAGRSYYFVVSGR
jgi:hypothetical protein